MSETTALPITSTSTQNNNLSNQLDNLNLNQHHQSSLSTSSNSSHSYSNSHHSREHEQFEQLQQFSTREERQCEEELSEFEAIRRYRESLLNYAYNCFLNFKELSEQSQTSVSNNSLTSSNTNSSTPPQHSLLERSNTGLLT